jgi:hypothetical protein
LHTSARFAAGNAVRGEARRRAREHEAVTMHEITSAPSVAWEQLRPLLDESVGQLKEADRDAIVLRFFEGKSHEEIGKILGLSENSANKRIERALDKLREYFSRRGVTASSALLATAIAENSVQAAPVGLAANVAYASLAAAGAATASAGLLATLFSMSTKAKIIVATTVILAVVATVAIHSQGSAGSPASAAPPSSASAAKLTSVAQVAQPMAPSLPAPNVSLNALAPQPIPPASSAGFAGPFTAGPKTDLNTAIVTAIHFIEGKDTLGFLQTMMPPEALAEENKGQTLQEFVDHVNNDGDTVKKLDTLLGALHAITDNKLTPGLNDDGTRATYHLDPPVDGHKVVIFNKVGSFWYLDGM